VNRGDIYRTIGRLDASIQDLNRAIQLNPNYFYAYKSRSRSFRLQRNYAQALADVNKSLEISPDYFLGYLERGLLYLETNQGELAIKDFKKMIALHPEKSIGYQYAGWGSYLLGNLEESLHYTQKCLQLDKDNLPAKFNLALIHLSLGNISKSKQLFKHAYAIHKKLYGKKAVTVTSTLRAYAQNGKFADQAKEILRKVFKEEI
ncbi:MAG: tetratricopeptide repeat protein, partial [Flammeovirgaceae bacterium]|nr:tetratricopeptide repeat protein [Flammeovirgaceae bacterium]MDW8287809.1 tetratricopeptide repeat protein [Flammeovirgaceae bacterium]